MVNHNNQRMITLTDVFTEEQINEFRKVFSKAVSERNSPHGAIVAVLGPLMPQVNERTGQKNDLHYWAYAIEYVLSR